MRKQNRFHWMSMMMIGFFLVMVCLTSQAWAAGEKYASRPIQIVVGYQPGTVDTSLRPFTDKLPEYLGQPISFLYKPGASGTIGASFVAKSKADGYTLLAGTPGAVVMAPLYRQGIGYFFEDLFPICSLVDSPQILVLKADSRWKSIQDVISEAKKAPGKITYSTSGVLGNSHIPVELFLKMAGLKMTHVPTDGAARSVQSLLGGHVDMVSVTMGSSLPLIKSGNLRLIASFDKQRLKEFPNAPTMSELGYPVVITSWYSLLAPKGTPPEVVKAIEKGCEKVMQEHKGFVADRVKQLGLRMAYLNTEQFTNELRMQRDALREIVRDLAKTVK